jgi:hypothetical protein
MDLYYTNIFHWNTLQNFPKSVFWAWKYATWQPWHAAVACRQSFRQHYVCSNSQQNANLNFVSVPSNLQVTEFGNPFVCHLFFKQRVPELQLTNYVKVVRLENI